MVSKILQIFKNNNFLSLTGSAAASALGFVSFAMLIRVLSKEAFGHWMIFLTIATIFELLRTGLLQTGLIKFSSGKTTTEQSIIIGSSWVFSIIVTLLIGLSTYSTFLFFSHKIHSIGALLFLKWYWLLTLVSLPFNFSSWYLQAKMEFRFLLFVRIIVLTTFIIAISTVYFFESSIEKIIILYILSQGFCSLVCFILRWTGISHLRNFSLSQMWQLFHFGKFSMGTMLGANLLRNCSLLLIGSFLGAEAVAVYSVPMKLFEIIEIPLRSFVATALPYMSILNNKNDLQSFSLYFEKTSGAFTLLLIPIALFCFLMAEYLVLLLGGSGYEEAYGILRIFAIYAVFMPIDRYSGIALDVINKPSRNFYKVLIMLLINIVGTITVIHFIGQLWSVAIVSIITFLSGVILGILFLKRYIEFSVKGFFIHGISECGVVLNKLKRFLGPISN